jgi:putative oxidoreductase
MPQTVEERIRWALLALRLGVFLVMLMWTLDKFVQPEHAAGVFAGFYGLEGLTAPIMYVVGVVELVIVVGFVLGIAKRFTYGAVLLFHTVSTLSSFRMYLGFDNLLFFAAWPMLAACFALYLLRDQDSLWTVSAKGSVKGSVAARGGS